MADQGGDARTERRKGIAMETHVLLGAEMVVTASSRMQAAVNDFARAVEGYQLENLRHEEQMRQIVAEFAEAVARMSPYAGMPR